MRSNAAKLTVVLLAGLLLLGTAGAASATDFGNISINLSTGEITDAGVDYTAYIIYTPSQNIDMNGFRFVVASDDSDVTMLDSAKTDKISAESKKFSMHSLGNGTSAYAVTGYLDPQATSTLTTPSISHVSLTANTAYMMVPFTIHVNHTTITNETVNLTFIQNENPTSAKNNCYVSEEGVSAGYKLGIAVNGTTYMLNNATANSVAVLNPVSVNIETNATIFDGNVSVFSELTKLIANSSATYYLNYSSSKEDVIKFYNNITPGVTPEFVVLKGSNSSMITVNLTNKTSGDIIDSKEFTVTTTKITLGADAFNYTANHTYPYTGSSVAAAVVANVTESLLNHSIGAANTGDDAQTYGYVRDIGKITLTFFSDAARTNMVEPIDGGTYYFNVTIAANENYDISENLTIANSSFQITGAPIKGVCYPLNNSYFNATTPAKMTVEFNATGMDLETSAFNMTTTVDEYWYFKAHYNLSFNQSASNYTRGDVTISDDNRTITFDNDSIKPEYEVTYFVFEGFPRGDVSLDGEVIANDASLLGIVYADPSSTLLTQEQKFYGNVKGSEKITLNDVRLIAQYAAGYLDDDYNNIKGVSP